MPTTAARPDDAAEDELLKINYVFNRGLHHLAIPRYEKLLADHPDFAKKSMVHYALALCHNAMASREPDENLTAAEKARTRRRHLLKAVASLEAATADAAFELRLEATEVLADVLMRLDRHADAQKAYQFLMKRASGAKKAEAAVGIADTLYHEGRHDAAARAYRQALSFLGDASSPALRERARFFLAMSLYNANDAPAEAEAIFLELAEGGESYAEDSRYMAALAKEKAGDDAGALSIYETLSRSEVGEWREIGLFGVGKTLFQAGRHEEAARRLDDLLKLNPNSKQRDRAALYRARAWLRSGQVQKAGKELGRLRKIPEVGEEASLWLARAYAERQKHDTAIRVLETAVERFPDGPHREVLDLEIALELIELERFTEAVKRLKDFAGRHPDSASRDHAAYLHTFAIHRAGQYDESLALCKRFAADYPESRYLRDVQQLIAENHYFAGRYDDAARDFKAYLDDHAAAIDDGARLYIRFRLAEASFYRRDYEDAVRRFDEIPSDARAFERALDTQPVFLSYHYLLGDACYQLKNYARAVDEFKKYLATAAASTGRHGADARFKLAHSLQLGGELEAARAAYARALEADPQSEHRVHIEFELGQAAFQEGKYGDARRHFTTVVKEAPGSSFAEHSLQFLGWMAQKEGRHDAAIAWYRRLVDDFPESSFHAEALYQMAMSMQDEARFDEARSILARLQQEHPGGDTIHKVRLQEGIALARQNNAAEALKLFGALGEERLDDELRAVLLYEIAWCYRDLEATDEAIATYRELMKMASAAGSTETRDLAATARLELAELEFDRDRFTNARDLLKPLAAGGGEVREKALYRLCWCNHRLKDHAATVDTYRLLEEAFPASEYRFEAAMLAARSHVARGAYGEAQEIFRSIVTTQPQPAEAELAFVSLAETLNEERRFEDAGRYARAFLDRYPESPLRARANFAAGWASENLGKRDDAIEAYRKATEASTPTAARAQFQIGQCLAARKDYKDAVVEFLQVPARFSYDDWSAKALLQVASCFEVLEDHENARKYYDEVIQKHADRDEGRLARERLARLEQEGS